MPRKKTIQPAPIQTIYVHDGIASFEIEIRDNSCYLISRGSHKRDAYNEKLWKVMEHVVQDYLSPSGRKIMPKRMYSTGELNNYLESPSKFATQFEIWGYSGIDGEDPSAIRKKLYTDVKRELKIFEGAIARNVKNIA